MLLSFETFKTMAKQTPEALKAASYILWTAGQTGRYFTPMQLLKLSYISHGWSLGLCEKPLFSDPVEAWKYGPVVPKVYHKYKRFGYSPILNKLKRPAGVFGKIPLAIMNRVVDVYGKYDGLHLSGLTHQPNSPWDITIKKYGEGAIISNEVIRDYYKSFAQANG